ncbi:putative negative regulator of RcsB-dependent stress response [Hypnocyclicus thermotrophus]|uniref:Negative regulator of RcsB-dependent stress response n=1 Tax=Hypnocyclicus thermotrophus TaxID=1627895 RepID=A0AA46I599_9FUSO|nr:tetratricopeptide repeat protein [Hypnocyclicus thermotrophus]TDT68649.1 putative negative regulator of RcsB-dependent stress response [Hypnocyclicus thermotrophus]
MNYKLFKLFIIFILIFNFGCSNSQKKQIENNKKQENYAIVKGINALNQNKIQVALESFLDAYSINSENIFTLQNLAFIYSEKKDYNTAESYYLKILSKKSNDTNTLYNISVLYYNQEKYIKALNYLKKISYDQLNDKILILKSKTYYALNDYKNAYNNIILIKNNNIDTDIFLVNILFKLNDISNLHPLLVSLYKKYPNNIEINILYSKHLYYNLNEYKKALNIINKYFIKNGVNKKMVIFITEICVNEKDFINAKKYINLTPEADIFDNKILELKKIIEKEVKNNERLAN